VDADDAEQHTEGNRPCSCGDTKEHETHTKECKHTAHSSYGGAQLIVSHSSQLLSVMGNPALGALLGLEGLDQNFGVLRAEIHSEPPIRQLPNLVPHLACLPFLFLY